MQHERVDSSNIYSLSHEGSTMEARFKCGACKGSGRVIAGQVPHLKMHPCEKCDGTGHTGTYVYKDVPVAVFHKVMAGAAVDGQEKRSIGKAFDLHVKKAFKGEKRK